MNKPIILTASQAQELHATGRLTGYREKCEGIELPKVEIINHGLVWGVKSEALHWLTEPPRDTDTTYAVKEPLIPFRDFFRMRHWSRSLPIEYHARITDIKLIISDGELWWDFGDLEKVG